MGVKSQGKFVDIQERSTMNKTVETQIINAEEQLRLA
jgi:hypothetical protein